ncbi:MAG: ComEA family DNA-binding protein [Candidatus Bipolaricaulota bacterium]
MDGFLKRSDRIILLVGLCIGCIALAHPHLETFFNSLFPGEGLRDVNGERIVLEEAEVRTPKIIEKVPPVDLNAAGKEKLEELPGVGPVLAERIVRHREEEGPFSSVQDLTEVRGIGPAKLREMKDEVTARS